MSCREDGVVDGGSVPCTLELDVSRCPAEDQMLDGFTRRLIHQLLSDYVARSDPRWNESKELSTMKRVVHGLVEKHRYLYNGLLNKLSLDNGVDVAFVRDMAVSLFGDGRINWGRVSSLLAFWAVMCRHLKETGRGDNVELVGQEICSYLLTVQRAWIVRNNSWEGFVKYFLLADPERSVRNTLLGLLGFAGVAATVVLWIR